MIDIEPDPDCPAPRHRSLRAHREAWPRCVCRGESWDRFQEYKAKAAESERDRVRQQRTHAFGAAAYPNPYRFFGDREFVTRGDKACLDEDPTLFDLEGDESNGPNRRQIAEAKAVCDRCPALDECRRLALADTDAWTIRGGMTPLERLAVQRGRRGDQAVAA